MDWAHGGGSCPARRSFIVANESLHDLVQRLRSEGAIIVPEAEAKEQLEACIEKGSVLAPQEGVQG